VLVCGGRAGSSCELALVATACARTIRQAEANANSTHTALTILIKLDKCLQGTANCRSAHDCGT
jgi:hypothetical protein